jgi:hypothetical protein
MVSVNWSEFRDAFDFASYGQPYESRAFVNLDTGLIHCVCDAIELDEEAPEDFETSDRYLALPHKNDLDLGRELALRFTEQHLPRDFDRVTGYFHQRGAYRRFRDLLEIRDVLELWYAFEQQATEQALRKWCAAHEIRLVPETGD